MKASSAETKMALKFMSPSLSKWKYFQTSKGTSKDIEACPPAYNEPSIKKNFDTRQLKVTMIRKICNLSYRK